MPRPALPAITVALMGAACAVFPALCQAQGYLITTVAGGGAPFTPAAGTSVSLGPTNAVAAGAHGNVYFIASNCVFEMDAAGIVTRVAGTSSTGYSGDGGLAVNAQLNSASGLAVDGSGNVFVADTGNNVVRKVAAATGIITTVAGNGTAGYSGDGGPAVSAQLYGPSGVAVDGFGNLDIADSRNWVIRKVAVATGIITTVAGNGTLGYTGDGGPAARAEMAPSAVAVDGSGDLFIADSINSAVREVAAATGIVTTVAGNGTRGYSGDGGPAKNAQLNAPLSVAVDSSGDIFIADANNNVIRKVTAATGVITTVAGDGEAGYTGDGGPATKAELNPSNGVSVAVDGFGNIFIADTGNNVIRKVASATGIITTVAGNRTASYGGDGGPGTNAQLNSPWGVAMDGFGNLYIADAGNNVVRKVAVATGVITTVAGNGAAGYSGDGGPAAAARLNQPVSVAADGSGNLYIADWLNNAIRKVTAATGIIATVAGNSAPGYSGDGGPASSATLTGPHGVAVDGSGNIFIADTGNNAIRKVSAATGIITTVAGNGVLGYTGDGGQATNAELHSPDAAAVDHYGNVFIADIGNFVIREVAATGIITTVAGNGTLGGSGDGGPATKAQLGSPEGVAVDGSGNLYIADALDSVIREVAAATGIITAVAGNGTHGYSGDGGPATSAELDYAAGVGVDGSGNLYIADTDNDRIRSMVPLASRALLSVTKTHTGSFTLGQTGATYSVVVSNATSAGTTNGAVTVSEIVPEGLALEGMSGAGWSCSSSVTTCTRSDALKGGTSYPPITVTVSVSEDGPSQAINQVTLTGGGPTVATAASDTTNILASASPIPPVTTVSAASGTAPVTADSIVSLYATNISTSVWAATAGPPAPLPTALGGVSATITDSSGKTAPISLIVVTPGQVNAVLPAGLQTGEAVIDLVSSMGVPITGGVTLVTVAPSLFTANESGGGIAAAQVVIAHQDGSQTFIGAIASCTSSGCTPIPIDLGSSTDQAVLELFGTGIRGAGSASNVTVSVGNTLGTVLYAGAQGGGAAGSYYGLDQVNVLLPRSLVGSSTVNVVLTAGGQTANTVTVDIQ